MKHGFKAVVPDLVRERPGLGPDDYARLALERKLCISDSKDPVFSLSSTLRKELRERRMPGIRAARTDDGKWCLYPADEATPAGTGTDKQTTTGQTVTLAVSQAQVGAIDTLVKVGQFATRSEAIAWLVGEGLKANSAHLEKAEDIARRIEELKRSLTE